MQQIKVVTIFLSCALVVVLSAPAVHAKDNSVLIRLSAKAVKKGYTVSATDGQAHVGIQPNVFAQSVTVRLQPYPDTLPDQSGWKRVSDVWVVDILSSNASNKTPVKLNKHIWLSAHSTSETLYRKRIFYWEKTGGNWRPLPSITDMHTGVVRAAFPLPYAPFAVFEEFNAFEGGASWFHHRLTNAAASNDFPMGSKLRVTDLENKKSVDVVVKSTGPFVRGRIIDLASKAFAKLRRLGEGVTVVRVELLSP